MQRLEIWKWCPSAIRVRTSTPRPALGAMTLKTGNGAARRRKVNKPAPGGAAGWLCFRFSFGTGSSFFCPNQLWILRAFFSALFIPGWVVSLLVGLVPGP